MLKDHLQLIAQIVKNVPPAFWPAAFAGIVVRATSERRDVAKYLQNILRAQAQAGNASDPSYDLTEESLIPGRDLPPSQGLPLGFTGYVPSTCHYNRVDPIFDPAEVFHFLELTGNEPAVVAAVHAIDEYAAQKVVRLKCAVHPYTDCALITAVLFALRTRILDGNMLQFVAADWADLPATLNGDNRYDFTYMSSGLKKARDANYEFCGIKKRVSKGRILINAEAYAALPASRVDKPRVLMRGFNFNGNFDPKRSSSILYFRNPPGEDVGVQLEGLRSDLDYEAKMVIALANGLLPYQAIVPSIHGFLWAAECGYLRNPDGTLGTLLTKEVDSSQGTVGYGVRVQPAIPNGDAKYRARFALTALMNLQKLFLEQIRRRLSENRIVHSRAVMGILKGPVLFARGYDSGILARIPADLTLSAAFPGESLFEKESTYIPPWWASLDARVEQESAHPIASVARNDLKQPKPA